MAQTPRTTGGAVPTPDSRRSSVGARSDGFPVPDQPDLDPDRLIGVMEAARRLGIDRSGLNRLIAAGTLPATKIGRGYAVTWRAIQGCAAIPTPTPQRAARRPRNRFSAADQPPERA